MAGSDSDAPRVSVIIATYNYSSVLRYAIETVLWQTFRDFELIVVGDCCTDDSEEVVQSFGDTRIRWLNLSENSGSKSLPQNAGIKIARGRFIAYLAHDDLWHPLHLETLVRAMEGNGVDLVHTVAVYVPPPGQDQRHLSGVFPDGNFRAGNALVHSTVMHPRALIDELGDWPNHRIIQMPGDDFFWTRAVEAGKHFLGVPKLTVWKFNASSRPNCYLTKGSDEQARYFELLRDDPDLVEKELIACAESAMRHGLKPLKAQKPARDTPPGSYVHLLRQIRGLEPMEPMLPLPPDCGGELFRFERAEEAPTSAEPLAHLHLEVKIFNDTSVALTSHPPHPVHFSYHWLHADGSIAVWDGARTALIPSLGSHARRYYHVEIVAPPEPGSYYFQPALVQEGLRWIEPVSCDYLFILEVNRSAADLVLPGGVS